MEGGALPGAPLPGGGDLVGAVHAAGAGGAVGAEGRVSATLADSHALRGWLMGFGARVEVVGPPALRAHFAETAAAMARRYTEMP